MTINLSPNSKKDNQQKITREFVSTTINENGEILEQRKDQHITQEREPDYIKLYIDGVLLLTDLPKGLNNALQHLLRSMNYQNIIVLNSGIKRIIAKELDITTGRLNNIITQLGKKGIMARIETGVYRFNPNIFGRGKWQDIRKIRMEVDFTEEKGAEISSKFEYEEQNYG